MRGERALFSALIAFGLMVADASAADIADSYQRAAAARSFSIVEPAKVRFGQLDYVGGFVIKADRREVGGLSGLVVSDAGQGFLSLSDDGLMVKARIERDARGRPTGLSSASVRRLQTAKGPLSLNKALSDTESIDVFAGDGGRPFGVVSFEQKPTVMIGPLGTDGFVGTLAAIDLPKEVNRLQPNRGLESVAALPAGNSLGGRFIILAEEARAGRHDCQPAGLGDRRQGTAGLSRSPLRWL